MSEISVTVVGSTTINPTVGNGDTVNVTIAATSERGPSGSPGAAGPANTLTIGTVSQGAAAATITGTSPNQVLNLVLQKGDAGTPATNIELQATATHLQWRLVGASAWTDLVALSAITGPTGSTGAAGAAVELQASGTHIQWRYVGGSTWTNVVALSSLVGATGATGATGPQGPAGSVNLADETPQPLGTASAGTALAAARADHVHAVGSITYSSLSGIPSTFAPSAHSHAVGDVTGLQTALDGKQPAGSYATLVGGTVPSSQLPSYVDDVIEYSALGAFPATNDGGKIFVARDTGKIYRWSGSAYVEISPSPGSTDSVTEGGVNLYHTTARAAAAAPVQSVAGRTGTVTLARADVGLGSVDNTADAVKPVSTAQAAADTAVQSFAIQRSNHTGTQAASTISDFATEAAKYGPVVSVNGQTGAVTVSGAGNYTLPEASASVLGGIKVGSGLAIASGVLSATGGGGSANIVEAATAAGFPATGASQTLYHATDVRKIFFWDSTGGVYVEAGPSGGGSGGDGTDAALRALFVPPAPTSVSATAGNAQATVSWTAPTVLSQTPITDYSVQFSSTGGPPWMGSFLTGSTSTSQVVTGLTNGTPHVFRVAAVNGAGTGSFSSPTSSVTPAVAPSDPYRSSVALLLSMDGNGDVFVDSSPVPKNVTADNVTQSATQSKFGGKSAVFSGSGGSLTIPYANSLDLSSSDFVVECWWYPTSNANGQSLFAFNGSGPYSQVRVAAYSEATKYFRFLTQSAATDNWISTTAGGSWTIGQWHHVAAVRAGSQFNLYINGTSVISFNSAASLVNNSSGIAIGSLNGGSDWMGGYIDDFRVTAGSNRLYAGATIPVPAAAFPNS